LFDLSIHEEEDIKVLVRTQVDAFIPGGETKLGSGKGDNAGLVTIKALNEFDSRAEGAGGAPDWRTKLDSQRGAVVATEMKNNSCKLAKWAVQSILAGAEVMKIG
jgi:translation initiation factor 3 subunit D